MISANIYLFLLLGLIALGVALFVYWYQRTFKKQEDDSQAQEAKKTEKSISVELPDKTQVEIIVSTIGPDQGDLDLGTTEIEPDQVLQIQITSAGEISAKLFEQPPWYSPSKLWLRLKGLLKRWPYSLPQTFFIGAILLYTLTRLIGISDYPIFFFTDEAVQTNLAADFMRDDFKNYDGEVFPTYFENVDKYSLSLTVYAQVLPYLFFGKSVFVTRAAAALITVLGAYWIGLILRDIFEVKYWWVGALLLSIIPAWFLHSRTAFEACMLATFYAGFLYYYLLYRYKEPKNLYLALVLGALAFYSYNPGRVVITLTGILLTLSDLRYHWQHRKIGLRGLGLLVLLILPFVRFTIAHPTAQVDQLRLLASYWVRPIPTNEKLTTFYQTYLFGLSPSYWFIPNDHDLIRHRMDGLPHIFTQTFLFAVIGFVLALRYFTESRYRTLVLALLAAPSGSALVGIGITRAMVYVIPAVLFISLGLVATLNWLEKRGAPQKILAYALFIFLASFNIYLLNDALVNGPAWETEYDLGGMQYGARQLFGALKTYLEENPDADLYVSPNWTNGAHVVARFFFDDPTPFRFGSVDIYLNNLLPDADEKVFVVTAPEYRSIEESGKFRNIDVIQTIPYPNNQPGFYFLTMEYVDNIAEILIQEIDERRQLVEDEIVVHNELVQVKYSPLDMGSIQDVFDDDSFTLARTAEANPFVIDLDYPKPHTFTNLTANISSGWVHISVFYYPEDSDEPVLVAEGDYKGSVDEPEVLIEFPEPATSDHWRIQVEDKNHGEPANVHVWELIFGEDK